MRILALSFFGIFLLVSGAPAHGADPGAEFERISAACRADKAGCEEALWTFVDINADDRLTVAEITRFFRFAIGGQHRPPAESSAADRLLASVIGGPLGARVFIKNFDYDGDGQVARKEFYQDAGDAGMQPLLVRLRQAFEQTAGQAAALTGSLLTGAKQRAPAASAPVVIRAQAAPHYAAFLSQAGQCWQTIASASGAKKPVFTYRIFLKTNGFLARNPKRRSRHSRQETASRLYEITKRHGLAAIGDCQPYELALEDYERWKELEVSFDPQGLLQVTAPLSRALAMANSPVYRVRKEKLSRRVSTSFDRQFLQCWKGQAKPTAFSKMKLVFRLHLAEDGSLQRKPELIGSKGVERDWQSIRDAIVKAFAECQPYDLPGRLYGQWHVLMVDVTQKGAKSH